MDKTQDVTAPSKRQGSLTATIGATATGAAAGVGMAYYSIRRYLYEALEKKGWFDHVQDRFHGRLEQALKEDAISYGYGGEQMFFRQSDKIAAEYKAACDRIIADKGISGFAKSLEQLEKSQKIKMLAFSGSAAVAVGAMTYPVFNQLLAQPSREGHASPTR